MDIFALRGFFLRCDLGCVSLFRRVSVLLEKHLRNRPNDPRLSVYTFPLACREQGL